MERTVADYLDQFSREFPFGANVVRLFRSIGAFTIYVGPAPKSLNAVPGSWVMHVRLPPRLEDSFGFNRQFVVFCTPVPDLQTRVVAQLKRLTTTASPPVMTDFAVVICSDRRAQDKVRDWAIERSEGLVVLAVDRDLLKATLDTDPAEAFPKLLSSVFAERNLYDERDPVQGERFFGRGEELRELDQIISQSSRHLGLFGLRRIGKTSLLFELVARLRRRPDVIPVYLDLEMSSGLGSAAHVAHRVGDAVAGLVSDRSTLSHRAALRALDIPDNWDEVDPKRLISSLGVRLAKVLDGGALSGQRLVVVLDEAEILLPNPKTPLPHTVEFLRMLRAVSQETRQLTLVLAGVNATPSESALLGDNDNPLFGLLSLHYLGPLELPAAEEMVRSVGRKMRIRWDQAPTAALVRHVGGHPLLARLLASDVATMNPERPLRPNLELISVATERFHLRNSEIFNQMLQSLKRYYPDELEILRLLATGDQDFARDLMTEDPTILNHLAGYGVVDPDTLSVSTPAFAAWLRADQSQ